MGNVAIYAHRKSSDTYVKVLSKIKDIYGSTETTDKSIKAKRVLLFLGYTIYPLVN